MGKVAMSAIFKTQKKRENSAMEEDKGREGRGRKKEIEGEGKERSQGKDIFHLIVHWLLLRSYV